MRRITLKDLDHVVDAINTAQDIPLKPWTRVDGKLVPTAWNYHIGGAYGGWRLEQHGSSGSGIRDVFQVGYVPKRELYGLLQAYRDGLRAALPRVGYWENDVWQEYPAYRIIGIGGADTPHSLQYEWIPPCDRG